MADILYTYNHQVYANITNKCDCRCTFCIRFVADGVGEASNLWHLEEPTIEQILEAIDRFDFSGYSELVFCGYGEPTCELDKLLKAARYAKEKAGMKIRVNTNGLGNLYHGRNITEDMIGIVDSISVSLNAPTEEKYNAVVRPQFEHAFEAMLLFAEECKNMGIHTQLTIVDVLPKEDKEACQKLADERKLYLKIREYSS
jgi:radical SAM enzyme (TIGR04100 family)